MGSEQPLMRMDSATFLATAPETISRLISTLTEKEILMFKGKTVRILDHHVLEHACEALN